MNDIERNKAVILLSQNLLSEGNEGNLELLKTIISNDTEDIKYSFELVTGIKIVDFVPGNNEQPEGKIYRLVDKFGSELKEGDIVYVQRDGEHEIYKKDDGHLYFKPYGEEDKVSAYFSDDIIKKSL